MKRTWVPLAVLLLSSAGFRVEGEPAGKPDARELLKSIPVLTDKDEKIESLFLTMTFRVNLQEQQVGLSVRVLYQRPDKYWLCVMDKAGVPLFLAAQGRMLNFDSLRQKVLSAPARGRTAFQCMGTAKGRMASGFGIMLPKEGEEEKPAINVDIASLFAGFEDRLTATPKDKTVILSTITDLGNELRAYLVPGTPFPCIAFEGQMKDEKEPMFEVRMTVNKPTDVVQFLLPDLPALKKHVDVEETPDKAGGLMAALDVFQNFLQTMMNIAMVRLLPAGPEGRAEVEKTLKQKIDWDAVKEFDRKLAEALAEAAKTTPPRPE